LYTISVTTTFNAGHQLKLSSVTEPYHIHDWIVEAAVGGKGLDENGLLFDFNKLKKILDGIVGPFNDRALEDLECFKNTNTSAENVAKYIFIQTKQQLPANVSPLYIEVTEAVGCKARYGEKVSI
jgi:6-pyruvoyltetrahydropterin/6-carboxytetrahydropterin synthase